MSSKSLYLLITLSYGLLSAALPATTDDMNDPHKAAEPGVDLVEAVDPTDDVRASMIASVFICFGFAIASVIARFVSRWIKDVSPTISDYLIIVGMVGGASLSAVVTYQTSLGLGRHMVVVPTENIEGILKTAFINQLVYITSFIFIKASILLLFCALFPTRGMQIACHVVMGLVIVWGVASILVNILLCRPIYGFWDQDSVAPACMNIPLFYLTNGILNAIFHSVILAIPVRSVWKLKMTRRVRMSVVGIFLLGGFVTIVSFLRIHFITQMNYEDLTWTYNGISNWSAIEVNVAVVGACLPTIRPAMSVIVPVSKVRSTLTRSNRSRSGTANNDDFQRLGEFPMSGIVKTTEITVTSNTHDDKSSKRSVDDVEANRIDSCHRLALEAISAPPRIHFASPPNEVYESPSLQASRNEVVPFEGEKQ